MYDFIEKKQADILAAVNNALEVTRYIELLYNIEDGKKLRIHIYITQED